MSSRFPEFRLSSTKGLLLGLAGAVLILAPALLLWAGGNHQSQEEANPSQPQPVASEQDERRRALRVCADPNNLPFSNQRLEGFENKIAAIIAREMKLPVEYTWWAQRRGFFRNTLKAGLCDVVIGVPSSFDMALTTAPYYRSTYA